MSQSARKYLIAGNWKMNLNSAEGAELAKDVVSLVGSQTDVAVCVCPTFTTLESVSKVVNDSNVQLGAQNMHFEASGAYTGEISAEMLRHLFVNFVILGHSERRALCGESDEFVGKKVKYAISKGLSVMACIGETLEEREAGQTLDVCRRQLQAIVNEITADDWAKVVIAYEPVWAIGTGKVATPEQAQEVHAGIRAFVAQAVSPAVASAVRIQYGGSVNPGNCEELAKMEDIDGFLVGGASLKGPDFVTICNAARFNN